MDLGDGVGASRGKEDENAKMAPALRIVAI